MKKAFLFAGMLIAAALVVTSCGGVKADEHGWYHDYDAAKAVANKQKKDIILFVSSFDSDEKSSKLNKDVFQTDEFKNSLAKQYVCINMDFSQSEYAKSQVGPEATEKEKKAAKSVEDKFNKDMKTVAGYSMETSPAVFLTTKEGYLISRLAIDDTVAKTADFAKLITDQKDQSKKINDLVAAVAAASNLEKAKAIDALYEASEPESRYLLAGLISEFITLDKENKTGLAGKYILADANVKAQNAFMDKKYDDVVKAFVDASNSPSLSADEKQQALYTAAYTMATTGSTDYDKIGEYFQQSFDANPQSQYAPQIAQMVEMVKSMKASAAAKAAEQPAAPAPAETAPAAPAAPAKK